jgi:SAM-dependent methyltransferase
MSSSIVDQVRVKYSGVARSGLSNDHAGVQAVAEAFGYSAEELASLPAEANMGLSCGNPTATANLKSGEVVIDLGCGGGIDVLLAAQRVGPSGKAIGIDMTPEMIERATASAVKAGITNVEFHQARMEAMPLPDESADVMISNCVINLAPDKASVFREMFRVLKPGGRVAVSDIALKRTLPDELARSVAAYVGCVAGAITFADYERLLADAGFDAVQVIDSKKDLNSYAKVENQSGCCGSGESPSGDLHSDLADLFRRYDVNEYAASARVFAVKPISAQTATPQTQEITMTTLQIFDKPMCCNTGICGPQVDPVLPKFAADLAWLKEQGITVERYNLAQQPQAFVADTEVKEAIREGHEQVLPLIKVDGRIVSRGVYPSREQLSSWCRVGVTDLATSPAAPASCCGPKGCC